MKRASHKEVNGILAQFDPHDVFEIGKHFKPEFVSETFTFRGEEFTIEIPFDMLEFIFGNGETSRSSVRTPNGTVAVMRDFGFGGEGFISLTTKLVADRSTVVVDVSKDAIDFLIFEKVRERIYGFSLSEPRIARVKFWQYKIGGKEALFDGPGKGTISIADYTSQGWSETGPCDVSSTEEAFEIAYQSFSYRLFRRIACYF